MFVDADVDECAEALDDCPTGSSCVNTHGAYLCKCDRDPYRPLMVINECQREYFSLTLVSALAETTRFVTKGN